MVEYEKFGDGNTSVNTSNKDDSHPDRSTLLYTVIAIAIGIVAISVVFVSI